MGDCCEADGSQVPGTSSLARTPRQNLTGRSCTIPRTDASGCIERCDCRLENATAGESPVRCRTQAAARCVLDNCCDDGNSGNTEPAADASIAEAVSNDASDSGDNVESAADISSVEATSIEPDDARWRLLSAEIRALRGEARHDRLAQLEPDEQKGLRQWLLQQRSALL